MRVDPDDIVGCSALSCDAIVEISKLVEATQENVTRTCGAFVPIVPGVTAGITRLVHGTVRGIAQAVDTAVKATRGATLFSGSAGGSSSPSRERMIAAINGVIGHHLATTGNPLAIRMCMRRNGHPLILEKGALRASIPAAGNKLLVLVHGLCCSDLQWGQGGYDYGVALARHLGYTPVYLHYNTGLHISENGEAFSDLLQTLVEQWPVRVQQLAILAYSAGGLISRSAYHYGTLAGHDWRRYLRHLIFIGTPHHGASWERWGNLVDVSLELSRFSAPYARIGKIRSAGITDLRYGNVRHEDWQGRDRFAHSPDRRTPLPLPDRVRCYAIAAVSRKSATSSVTATGDGVVPLDSALGRHPNPSMTLQFPRSRQWIGFGMNHWDLLSNPEVYGRIRQWLQPFS